MQAATGYAYRPPSNSFLPDPDMFGEDPHLQAPAFATLPIVGPQAVSIKLAGSLSKSQRPRKKYVKDVRDLVTA